MPSDLLLIQTVLPDYRQSVFELLARQLGNSLRLASGDIYFYPTVTTGVTAVPYVRLRNRYLAGRRLLWQSGVLSRGARAKVVILELNPRVVSTWALLMLRRALRKPTLLWGHAWPRAGSSSRTDRLRHCQRMLASGVILYTPGDASALKARMPNKPLFVAPNAIFRREDVETVSADRPGRTFLFTGRLIPAKKPLLLLEAFQFAISELPDDVNLTFIGEGPLRETLQRQVDEAGLAPRVRLTGHLPPTATTPYYEEAIASVSSGYVGLSLTQSLAHGVPMIIARDDPHSPEIDAVIEGVNAMFFDSDSVAGLAQALVAFANDRVSWRERAHAIAESCGRTYSAEAMADGVIEAAAYFDSLGVPRP